MVIKLEKTARYISSIFFIIYLLLLSYLLFFSPEYGRTDVVNQYNLEPFKTIKNYIIYREYVTEEIFLANIFGNIVAFMPMGFFIPVLFRKNRAWTNVLFMSTFISLTVEIIQYRFSVGSFDIDDIILNTSGGILGYILFKVIYVIYNKLKKVRILR